MNTPTFLKHSHSTPFYEDGTECSETSAYKIQTPRSYPEESIKRIGNCGRFVYVQKKFNGPSEVQCFDIRQKRKIFRRTRMSPPGSRVEGSDVTL